MNVVAEATAKEMPARRRRRSCADRRKRGLEWRAV